MNLEGAPCLGRSLLTNARLGDVLSASECVRWRRRVSTGTRLRFQEFIVGALYDRLYALNTI